MFLEQGKHLTSLKSKAGEKSFLQQVLHLSLEVHHITVTLNLLGYSIEKVMRFNEFCFVTLVTASLDTGQKNLSAFCSDMLDEYLESEGKLIDERAASFSQAVVTPVAYQLPTKSTSYVRTLDSVLKKQSVPSTPSLSNSSSTCRKTALTPKSKKSIKSGVKNTVSSTNKKSERSSLKKSTKPETSRLASSASSTTRDLSQSKKASKIKTKKVSKTSQHSLQSAGKPVKERGSAATEGQTASSTPGSNPPVGRSSGLPKTLVKLRDVEDGAVWEGKNRTYITMERAAIALSCLVTAEVCVSIIWLYPS